MGLRYDTWEILGPGALNTHSCAREIHPTSSDNHREHAPQSYLQERQSTVQMTKRGDVPAGIYFISVAYVIRTGTRSTA